ncbi:MAG: formate C-acetyltransferase [Erysipelotrichaceae bacterium]|nr:formate C-acetyltransferase [Erysipelotrichaceae bacterium]
MNLKYSPNWDGFKGGIWQEDIDVRDFIQKNYTPYEGDESFLAPATEATKTLWQQVLDYKAEEIKRGGVYDAETRVASRITSYGPGYLNKDLEQIVGVQTDKPFKRGLLPFGGIRMAEQALNAYGYELDPDTKLVFDKYRKTHNDGVFSIYNDEIRQARRNSVITGLPDAYGRGRIIGDYRRVALYGIDRLIEQKQYEKEFYQSPFTPETNRMREEIHEQINALKGMLKMAGTYGFDISKPAANAKEAVQWTYFAYLAAIKEQNGAAMSLGRVSTFLDIYFEKDIAAGILSESEAQEIIDHFVMKLRMVQFIRTPGYNDIFSGDPTWVTEAIGGMGLDGRTLVTKTSFRFLHTLINLGPAPEPNLTVLWSKRLPSNFKKYCAKISIETSSIQYENDDLMLPEYGDDYGIACCVSAMRIGKDMQFFGARANLAKALLYAINGGVDEVSLSQVSPKFAPITSEVLDYDEVIDKYDQMLDWLARVYVDALNIIHYSHDKYSYESAQMALHDREVRRFFATGVAGLSVVADSLSAIKYATVKPIRNEQGIAVDFEIEGDYPKYGNNDDRVDLIAKNLVSKFMDKIRRQYHYRDSVPSLSILTITSNVMYGKGTGSTPDGRKVGEAFAPGANPMHGRDHSGALASLESVAKLPYQDARDGISNTFSIVPEALGKN